MRPVVQTDQTPVVFLRRIGQRGKQGIQKAESRPGVIRLDRDAQDGIHCHVQYAAVRDDQIAPRPPVEQALDSAPGAQVNFPAAFAGLADVQIRMDEIRPRKTLGGFIPVQSGQSAVVQFLPDWVELQRDVQRRGNDFCRLSSAQERAGNASIKSNTFCQPTVRESLRLGAALFGQREIILTLEAVFSVADRLAVAEEDDVVDRNDLVHRSIMVFFGKHANKTRQCKGQVVEKV